MRMLRYIVLVALATKTCLSLPFSVVLGADAPLGLRLSSDLLVIGFHRHESGVPMQAEASGWIKEGDKLVGINELTLEGVALPKAQAIIAGTKAPRTLHFHAVNNENRTKLMEESEKQPPKRQRKVQGRLELAKDELTLDFAPRFLQADFGGPIVCKPKTHRIVFSHDPHGCLAHDDEASIADSLLVVFRGMCQFMDKAILAQQAGAAGLIVVNIDNTLDIMPKDETQTLQVSIPIVMIHAAMGAEIKEMARISGTSNEPAVIPKRTLHGRLVLDSAQCAPMDVSAYSPKIEGGINPEEFDSSENGSDMAAGSVMLHIPAEPSDAEEDEEDGAVDASHRTEKMGEFLRAKFGFSTLPKENFIIVSAPPEQSTACDEVSAKALYTQLQAAHVQPPYALALLVSRGGCTYQQKLETFERTLKHFANNGIDLARHAALLVVNTKLGLTAMEPPPGAPGVVFQAANATDKINIFAAMITRDAARKIQQAAVPDKPTYIQLHHQQYLLPLWEELSAHSEPSVWQAMNIPERRKRFAQLSKKHHPDAPTGDQDRFETLVSFAGMGAQ